MAGTAGRPVRAGRPDVAAGLAPIAGPGQDHRGGHPHHPTAAVAARAADLRTRGQLGHRPGQLCDPSAPAPAACPPRAQPRRPTATPARRPAPPARPPPAPDPAARSSAPRDGTGKPRALHTRATSRCTADNDRHCRPRYRDRSVSRSTVSTSSGNRPPPRPPPDRPTIRSVTSPGPSRQQRTSEYTRRRDIPSSAAATSAASTVTRPACASRAITADRWTATSHATSGADNTPRSASGSGGPSITPHRRAHDYGENRP
jgi:hypothetical protein